MKEREHEPDEALILRAAAALKAECGLDDAAAEKAAETALEALEPILMTAEHTFAEADAPRVRAAGAAIPRELLEELAEALAPACSVTSDFVERDGARVLRVAMQVRLIPVKGA